MSKKGNIKMGWLPDYPDLRDATVNEDKVKKKLAAFGQVDSIRAMLDKTGINKKGLILPDAMDLREWCPPVEYQEDLGSCTANAGVAMIEYFERRAFGKHIDASRLFLYKTTRNLLQWTGDTGAFLRSTMGAMVLFGVPPEEYWPYDIAKFEEEPPAFCYAFAQNYRAINYYRLDIQGIDTKILLEGIKGHLAAGLPLMFGFTVYKSYVQAETTGKIPFPTQADGQEGGHAVVAVGYDDKMKIKNTNPGGVETTGALLIRNSWGQTWGSDGYGWLPYEYVLTGLAIDWWALLKNEWIDTGNFSI